MLEGLYSAAAGMEAQQHQLDALSNDLANIDTPGYQATRVGFEDLLYTSAGTGLLPTGAGAASEIMGRSQIQGAIQSTGRPLDVAIVGDGFIQIRRPDGSLGLSRNGALQINSQGQLCTNQGMLLEPPVTVPAGVNPNQIHIGTDGTVTAVGRTLGRITLVTVPAPDKLLADGGSVFSATTASGAIRPATGATVQQGALEASNVDMAKAMATMIDTQQSYSMASKAISMQDQMLQIANQVKR